jgi:hypothetical protein
LRKRGDTLPINYHEFQEHCLYWMPSIKASVAVAEPTGRTSLTNLYAIVKQSLRSGVILGPGQTSVQPFDSEAIP